jgi:hypothetical protein
MYQCLAVITVALLWMLYECDWLRLRMLVGPNITSCPWSAPNGIRLTRKDFLRVGLQPWGHDIDYSNGQPLPNIGFREVKGYKPVRDAYFSVGVFAPLCGWDWIESRLHPKGDCSITIIAWGVRSTATFTSNDPKRMKDYCTAALKPDKEQRKALTKQRRASKLALAC